MENFKRIDSHWINPESPWNMIRGKYLFENPKILNKDSKENNLLSLTLNGVLNKDMDSGGGLRPDSYESYQMFYENELVFKLIDLENVKTSRVGWVHERGLMSPVYIRLKPKEDKTNTRYFYYYFFDLYQRHIFNSIGSGIRSSLSGTNLLELLVPNPSHEEQNKIVGFLDKKTTQIDKLIKKIEQKIELLKEQKNSLISEVVTKGLNPDVDMKDSGVEWIGEIPSHWEITKVKFISNLVIDGSHHTPTYTDSGVPFLRVTDLHNERVDLDKVKFISEEEHQNLVKRTRPERGDVLLSKNGTIGLTKVIDWDWEFSIFVSLCLIKFKETFLPELFSYFFQSSIVDRQIKESSKQSTVTNLHLDKIRELLLINPPVSEQLQMIEYLDEQTKEIDKAILIEEKRIKLLNEYKQSLISEVVTGKKRVV